MVYQLILTVAVVAVAWRFIMLPKPSRTVKISALAVLGAAIVLPFVYAGLGILTLVVQIVVAIVLAIYVQVFSDAQ